MNTQSAYFEQFVGDTQYSVLARLTRDCHIRIQNRDDDPLSKLITAIHRQQKIERRVAFQYGRKEHHYHVDGELMCKVLFDSMDGKLYTRFIEDELSRCGAKHEPSQSPTTDEL